MHVAASNPQYIDRTAIPQEVLDYELTVLKAQAMEENAKAAKPKPENIIEKMVEGRLNKNLKRNVFSSIKNLLKILMKL